MKLTKTFHSLAPYSPRGDNWQTHNCCFDIWRMDPAKSGNTVFFLSSTALVWLDWLYAGINTQAKVYSWYIPVASICLHPKSGCRKSTNNAYGEGWHCCHFAVTLSLNSTLFLGRNATPATFFFYVLSGFSFLLTFLGTQNVSLWVGQVNTLRPRRP